MVEAFAPWMQPLDNSGQILSPWLDTDIVMATTMVGTFVDVVKVIHEEFEGETSEIENISTELKRPLCRTCKTV